MRALQSENKAEPEAKADESTPVENKAEPEAKADESTPVEKKS